MLGSRPSKTACWTSYIREDIKLILIKKIQPIIHYCTISHSKDMEVKKCPSTEKIG